MDLDGRNVLVMGLGAFGGGEGVVQWLLGSGAEVTITDLRDESSLAGPLSRLDTARCRLALGGHSPADFERADLVVVNPAVPRPASNPMLAIARAHGATLTTEIRLLVQHLDRSRCIGITGTAGKSTTAAMTHHLLTRGGLDARLGGNIGGSLLCELDRIEPDTWVVLELSSAQLHWLDLDPGWSPAIAGITNVSPNHLDWHEDEADYRRCKAAICRHGATSDPCIHGHACPPVDAPLRVPGEHNRINAAMAVALARLVDPSIDPSMLAGFEGLPHRLRPVGTDDPPRFYDDSKATTPEATLRAIASFPDPTRIHLLAGGYDKGVSLQPIADAAQSLAGLYTFGETGPPLAAAGGGIASETLEQAVAAAMPRMRGGDILLLSPGCASWDQFADYRERGRRFTSLVSS
ncbi:MAG: UDP-N-acetylmuramoyl-L-alanine--D-glutamate ligase [Phycisphaerales bacterium]|jgi:UDP-N-acetylmuramoylalanine--D-glutamate ligase|nr:UDP-N-acetylmuramoyl-L-alanine--D-glutamate ligase [Phycisphaerales bacterium]